MKKIQVNMCETDNIYIFIAGCDQKPITQEFKFFFKDKQFWEKIAYIFLPNLNQKIFQFHK